GFAVVASEVRSLAGRSAEAAKQIKELITTSVRQVESGAGLVNQAGATMQEIVGAVGQVSGLLGGTTCVIFDGSTGGSKDRPDWGVLWRFTAETGVTS
ncbi:hypothetical protein JVW19_19685, partial [Vibrio cholerae O1]|nr:hypothetical protein [Vibrio cholerae O1]